MCLGIPAKIIEITREGAHVDIGGTKMEISLALIEGGRVETGDYVIVHAGFAIEKVDEGKALEAISLFNGFAGKKR
ncbi:MAG: HypC/HybG/HupF family hydrogenase formation chaperone [Deltaproteobacteria bacterium]|nr:HypC/HybG/HupF family hydrogenase formation chaperone [Deltaproteobacteria bacterium]